jgi:hypothetical protein
VLLERTAPLGERVRRLLYALMKLKESLDSAGLIVVLNLLKRSVDVGSNRSWM